MRSELETEYLIESLLRCAHPIRSLPPPWRRTVEWLAIALPAVAVVVVLETPRDDLAQRLVDIRFLTEQAAALASAVTAAAAAFILVIPGRDQRFAFLPLAPVAVWLGSLGQDGFVTWLKGGDAFRLTNDWVCFPGIAVAGTIPALTMVVMLRRGVPLAPRTTMLLGAFAAAALGSVGLRLFHAQDAGLMVLVWQFGSVTLLSALACWGGRRILRW